jgi:predicted dehydrogenase
VLVHRSRSGGGSAWADTDVTRHEFHSPAAHTAHVANFLAAIGGQRDVVCSGQDGLEAVRLVLASYESAETQRLVTLDAD